MTTTTDYDTASEHILNEGVWGEFEDKPHPDNAAHNRRLYPRLRPGLSSEFALETSYWNRLAMSEQDLERLYQLLKAWREGELVEKELPVRGSEDEVRTVYIPEEANE